MKLNKFLKKAAAVRRYLNPSYLIFFFHLLPRRNSEKKLRRDVEDLREKRRSVWELEEGGERGGRIKNKATN